MNDLDPNQAPRPLAYAEPRKGDQPTWVRTLIPVGSALLGVAAGVVIVIFGGCGVMNAVGYPYIGPPSAPRPPFQWWPPTLFFAAVIGSAVGAVMLYRAHKPWFLVGLLIGIGVMSLVEGLCFANP